MTWTCILCRLNKKRFWFCVWYQRIVLSVSLQDSPAKNFYKELSRLDCFDSYSRCDHEFCQFKNYNLTFTSYARPAKSAPFWELPFRHNLPCYRESWSRIKLRTGTLMDIAYSTVVCHTVRSTGFCGCAENVRVEFSHVAPTVRLLVEFVDIVFEWTSVRSKRKIWFKFGHICAKSSWWLSSRYPVYLIVL